MFLEEGKHVTAANLFFLRSIYLILSFHLCREILILASVTGVIDDNRNDDRVRTVIRSNSWLYSYHAFLHQPVEKRKKAHTYFFYT